MYPSHNEFLLFRDNGWTSMDGSTRKIKHLSTPHVVNIINWMGRAVGYSQNVRDLMYIESMYRGAPPVNPIRDIIPAVGEYDTEELSREFLHERTDLSYKETIDLSVTDIELLIDISLEDNSTIHNVENLETILGRGFMLDSWPYHHP